LPGPAAVGDTAAGRGTNRTGGDEMRPIISIARPQAGTVDRQGSSAP